jgi:hypothetical protein
MDRDPYRLWEVLGTWAAAVGTIAAVVTSLWIALRRERPRLRVRADQRLLVEPSQIRDRAAVKPDEMPEFLYVEVTNVGMPSARIVSIGWHWVLLKSQGRASESTRGAI